MTGKQLLLALDFGGTKHVAGLMEAGGREWLAYQRIPAPQASNGEKDQAAMFALADQLLTGTDGELVAVGVSFGGPVDWERGEVILSHHVPGWESTPLPSLLQARYHVPVSMDNDANAAALGEWRFGAGAGCSSLLYITISTGIGGGWVINGDVFRGADSMAGEIGHLSVDPNGPLCVCGKHGCVEVIGCGTAIGQEMAARLTGTIRQDTDWAAGSQGDWTGERVNQAAENGDPLAIDVMEHAAWALGVGIGYTITLMNPQKIVIGGGVANAGPIYWNKLRSTASSYILPQMRLDLTKAALGGDSPLWGAMALAEKLI